MSVVIDFAYCQDVKTAMNKNFELTGEVISLSHRFEISELTDVVVTVASSQVAIDNSIRLYQLYFQGKKEFCKSERINNIKPEDRNNLMVLYTIF